MNVENEVQNNTNAIASLNNSISNLTSRLDVVAMSIPDEVNAGNQLVSRKYVDEALTGKVGTEEVQRISGQLSELSSSITANSNRLGELNTYVNINSDRVNEALSIASRTETKCDTEISPTLTEVQIRVRNAERDAGLAQTDASVAVDAVQTVREKADTALERASSALSKSMYSFEVVGPYYIDEIDGKLVYGLEVVRDHSINEFPYNSCDILRIKPPQRTQGTEKDYDGNDFTVSYAREFIIQHRVPEGEKTPILEWPSNFYPRTDATTDMQLVEGAAMNVFWVTELSDFFIVAGYHR